MFKKGFIQIKQEKYDDVNNQLLIKFNLIVKKVKTTAKFVCVKMQIAFLQLYLFRAGRLI